MDLLLAPPSATNRKVRPQPDLTVRLLRWSIWAALGLTALGTLIAVFPANNDSAKEQGVLTGQAGLTARDYLGGSAASAKTKTIGLHGTVGQTAPDQLSLILANGLTASVQLTAKTEIVQNMVSAQPRVVPADQLTSGITVDVLAEPINSDIYRTVATKIIISN